MIRYLFPGLLFFLVNGNAHAQSPRFSFTLEGTMNTDSGTVELLEIGDTADYPFQQSSLKAPLAKGKFILRGFVLYPSAFRVGLLKGEGFSYISDFFLVDPGFQTISCNVDSLREVPSLVNSSMNELNHYNHAVLRQIKNARAQLNEKQDRLAGIYGKKMPDSLELDYRNKINALKEKERKVLLGYTEAHPDSYVALWELIRSFGFGYETIWDSVYSRFSDNIKNTFTGKVLRKKLTGAGMLALGNPFPRLDLLTIKNKPVIVPSIGREDKYILIDFWFSHCDACIGQFPELKNIFAFFHPKGFGVMGISTDGVKLISLWKNTILKYQLPWKQYLDTGGKEADELSIKVFPTNFLVDSKGRIIARDLDMTQLRSFLKQNLL